MCQQREERRLDFEGDGAGGGGEGGEEADELDGVTEAVVAADEDIAVPERPAVPDPAQVVGQRGVVAPRRITSLENVIRNLPGRFMIAGARGRHPSLM
jgi:hypothetical protein